MKLLITAVAIVVALHVAELALLAIMANPVGKFMVTVACAMGLLFFASLGKK